MNKYEKYKETNLEWLGEIPSSWVLSRVGKFFTERSEKVDDISYPPLSVTMSGIVEQLLDVAKSDDNDNRKLVKKDDFVINSRSDRKGSSGISPRDGSVSVINIVLEPKGIAPKYSEYLFKSYYFKEEFFRNGKGIHWDLWSTRWEQFKNINIPTPEICEQKVISQYLDKKTHQIDSLILNIQNKIKILKEQNNSLINNLVTKGINFKGQYKDSGVDLIGRIPKHWSIFRLAVFGKFYKGKTITNNDLTDSGSPVILYSHIYTSYNREIDKPIFYISENLYTESIKIKNKTFLFTSSGESIEDIGKCVLFSGETECSIGGDMVVFELNDNKTNDHKFFSFVLNSSYVNDQKSSNSRGEIIVHIYEKQLREIWIAVPPLEEQIQISKKLLINEVRFNRLTELLSKQVRYLKEFRQSLISSSVTGKIKVTEEMI